MTTSATPHNNYTRAGKAELWVDGAFYGGWVKLRASRSIECLAGTFDLEITERWPNQPTASPIRAGQRCRLYLDEQRVNTGYVDTRSIDFDSGKHTVRVVGRDKTADLIDCSAIYKSGQWHNVKLDQLARDLLKPYDIKVIVATDVGKAFASFSIEEGESVFECLERAARQRAVLLTSDENGDLVIARAGIRKLDVALVEGQNIKAARADFTWKDRYSEYVVKGQGRLGEFGETEHAAPSGKASDEVISRHRPLVVISEIHSSNATAAERATWEKNVRRGRSVRGSITVQGWCDPSGELWRPNTLVPVTSPTLWLDNAEMLIVGCVYTLDETQGTLTELAIAQPEAFQMLEGVGQGKVFSKKLKTKEQRDKKEKVNDWSAL